MRLRESDQETNTTIFADDETYYLQQAIPYASGSASCRTNNAGGALFWFKIMTTIGYGRNTSPVTAAGRLLVFTFGGLTIILFLALNATAGNVVEVVVDDFLIRKGLRRLTRGFPAVLVWLVLTISWTTFVAVVSLTWTEDRLGGPQEEFTVQDALWFSYITITTVYV